MKVLLSWIGWADFNRKMIGEKEQFTISETSPNLDIHLKSGLSFDRHMLLTNSPEDAENKDYRNSMLLYSELSKRFRHVKIDLRYVKIEDAYSLEDISPAIEAVLDEFKDDEINILFSMGTSMMSVAWFNLYEKKPYRIKLIFGRDPKHLKQGKPQFEEVRIKHLAPGIQSIKQSAYDPQQAVKITNTLAPLYDKARIAARQEDISILILGESGTGKEELAKYIKQNSLRSDKEFISVNCAALGDSLLESRLFGHIKGAFTDAKEGHKGFFEQANGGTIFLDEIGDISPKMQQSLLRVLQEGKFQKGGSSREITVNVRILAATNKDLLKGIKTGSFREDLYYRLKDVAFTLPSFIDFNMAERKELVDHFINRYASEFQKKLKFDKESLYLIYNYTYPGNIRQLQSLIKNIFVFNEGTVSKEGLPEELIEQDNYKSPVLLEEVKMQHVRKIYRQYGLKKPAAKALGIHLLTLKKYIDE